MEDKVLWWHDSESQLSLLADLKQLPPSPADFLVVLAVRFLVQVSAHIYPEVHCVSVACNRRELLWLACDGKCRRSTYGLNNPTHWCYCISCMIFFIWGIGKNLTRVWVHRCVLMYYFVKDGCLQTSLVQPILNVLNVIYSSFYRENVNNLTCINTFFKTVINRMFSR